MSYGRVLSEPRHRPRPRWFWPLVALIVVLGVTIVTLILCGQLYVAGLIVLTESSVAVGVLMR